MSVLNLCIMQTLHVATFTDGPCCCARQGCMKSGQVLTDRRYKWFEPEYWRFGDPASAEGQINYMRHASGQVRGTLCQDWSLYPRAE